MAKKKFKELWTTQAINKIDDVLELDIKPYYKQIIIKQLIIDWRNK